MKNRIYAAALAAGIAATITLTTAPAEAGGPTPQYPSTVPISQHTAHRAAVTGTRDYLHPVLAKSRYHISRCTHGPMVWHCPMRLWSEDTKCTAVVWVWSDGPHNWFEYHRMRCTPRAG